MDFHGQKLSETIYQILILAFSVRVLCFTYFFSVRFSKLSIVFAKRR